jgi:hypothetical protein
MNVYKFKNNSADLTVYLLTNNDLTDKIKCYDTLYEIR